MFLFSPGSGLGGEEIGRQEHYGRCYWCLIWGPSGWQMFKDDSLGNRPGYLPRFSFLGMFLLGEYILDSGSCFAPLWELQFHLLPSLMISSHHLVSGLIGHDLKWPHAGVCLRHGSPLSIGNSCAFCLAISGSTVTPKWSSVLFVCFSCSQPMHLCQAWWVQSIPQLLGTQIKYPKWTSWSPFFLGWDEGGNDSTLPHLPHLLERERRVGVNRTFSKEVLYKSSSFPFLLNS